MLVFSNCTFLAFSHRGLRGFLKLRPPAHPGFQGSAKCDCPAQWGLPRSLATMPQGTDPTLWYGPGAPRKSQATLTDGPTTGNLSSCYPPGGMANGNFGIRRLLVAQHTAFLASANLQMARHTQFWHLAASWWASECQFGILASLRRRGR